jgi:phenylacetate-coenzyme A ligase PaaK-like adenylate-forming protein
MSFEDLLHPLLARYLAAPDWVKASAGRAYAWVPERFRFGGAYHRFREELALRDAEPVQRLARRKLRATLEWAMKTVPAYRDYAPLLAHCEDTEAMLSKLPLADKAEIKARPGAYVSAAVPASARLKSVTGGSSRNPLEFYLQKHVSRPKEYAFMHDFRARAGSDGSEPTLALRGRPVPGAAKPGGRIWTWEPIKRQLIFSSAHLDAPNMPRYAEALALHRPRYIEAYPSVLYLLARWLTEHPLPQFTSAVRGVLLYSETAYDFQTRLFREVFRCPVLKHYGHSERVLMAASMPDDERYFFWPQYGWFELVGFDGKPLREAGVVGEIVGTSFDNRAMPFVRYRTGDMAVLSGRGHPRLPGFAACERIQGRLQEFIVDRHERLVSVVTIGAAHFAEFGAIDAMQYEQRRPGELVLKFVAGDDFTPDMQKRLAAAIGDKAGCDVRTVKVRGFARTARGKHQLLVQHLDIGRYLGVAAIA